MYFKQMTLKGIKGPVKSNPSPKFLHKRPVYETQF